MSEFAIDLGIERSAASAIIANQLVGRQDFLLLVRIATQVKVEVACPQLLNCIELSFGVAFFFYFRAIRPPVTDVVEMFGLDWLGLREMLIALGHIHTVEPHPLRFLRVVEEKDVGSDARIGRKNTLRHAYDGVQIELINKTPLNFDLRCILAEQKTIRDDDRCAAILFEAV